MDPAGPLDERDQQPVGSVHRGEGVERFDQVGELDEELALAEAQLLAAEADAEVPILVGLVEDEPGVLGPVEDRLAPHAPGRLDPGAAEEEREAVGREVGRHGRHGLAEVVVAGARPRGAVHAEVEALDRVARGPAFGRRHSGDVFDRFGPPRVDLHRRPADVAAVPPRRQPLPHFVHVFAIHQSAHCLLRTYVIGVAARFSRGSCGESLPRHGGGVKGLPGIVAARAAAISLRRPPRVSPG